MKEKLDDVIGKPSKTLEVGDWVLVSQERLMVNGPGLLKSKYAGPFRILRKFRKYLFELEIGVRRGNSSRFYIYFLKKFNYKVGRANGDNNSSGSNLSDRVGEKKRWGIMLDLSIFNNESRK
jgi:hypothetical protein